MTPSKPIYTKEYICDGMLRSVGVTKINVDTTVSKNTGRGSVAVAVARDHNALFPRSISFGLRATV
jgi:hypothetical protein